MKKLSDPYIIRSTAAVPTLGAGASPAATGLSTIDTGLDSLRREVLAVWSVNFGYTGADDGSQMEQALEACRAFISAGTGQSIAGRYGVTMALNKEPQGLVESFGNANTVAIDAVQTNFFAWDVAGPSANEVGIVTTTEEFRFPEIYDPNEPGVPLCWVTDSQMEFVASAFVDGVTTTGNVTGITGSCRIIAQRYEADASLFAAILTGNA